MKTKIVIAFVLSVFALNPGMLSAENGDLTVNGTLNVGAGGIKFPDGSIETTAKKLVWEKTVTGSAVTSVTTNGDVTLDGDADGGYVLEYKIVQAGSTGGTAYSIYANGDLTGANYKRSVHYGGALGGVNAHGYDGASGNSQFSLGFTQVTSSLRWGRINIAFDSSWVIEVSAHDYQRMDGGNSIIGDTEILKTAALSSTLNRLDIVGSVSGSIGVGSWFRLYRKK